VHRRTFEGADVDRRPWLVPGLVVEESQQSRP
jgi:hypothetical protein